VITYKILTVLEALLYPRFFTRLYQEYRSIWSGKSVWQYSVYANGRCEIASQACLEFVYIFISWNNISFQSVSVVVIVLCACPFPFIVTKEAFVAVQ
jgi:hypothetical protein